MSCIVADAGPLIALAKLDLLGLPARAFGQTIVPATVLAECTAQPQAADAVAIRAAIACGDLKVQDDAPWPPDAPVVALDEGERAAIALALALAAPVLIDERRGRFTAQRLGVKVVGVCGLLLIGRREGWVGVLAPLLDRLHGAGYFIAPDLRAAVLAAAGEP
jgi:predicted nucleic acid-binding protein